MQTLMFSQSVLLHLAFSVVHGTLLPLVFVAISLLYICFRSISPWAKWIRYTLISTVRPRVRFASFLCQLSLLPNYKASSHSHWTLL